MEWASPPPPAPPQGMMDVVLEAPSPPPHYPASAHGNGNSSNNASDRPQPPLLPAASASQYLHAPTPGAAAGAPPLSSEWSVDGHPLCHSRLLSATGVMGRVEAYRRRPMVKKDWQQQQQATGAAAGTIEEFLVRLTDGCEGVVTEPLVQEGIARLLATASSEKACARGKEGGVMGGSATGGGGGSSSTSPKRKDKSGSHHRRESSSGGGGGGGGGGSLGIAAGTVERLAVPLPMEPADKSCLTPGETQRCLELVRRLATPYFAREFSQPIEELHPELWKEVREMSEGMGWVGLLPAFYPAFCFSSSLVFSLIVFHLLPPSLPPSLVPKGNQAPHEPRQHHAQAPPKPIKNNQLPSLLP